MAGDEPHVGICVSGGGLRAAAFGLGALQALQHHRKLLRGDGAARYLSAVSGGSYIAGTYTLVNCSDRVRPAGGRPDERGVAPDDPDPLAPGSPEAEHLRRHCRYMIEGGGRKTSLRLAGLAFINLVAVVSLPICIGALLAWGAGVGSSYGITAALDRDGHRWWAPAILSVTLIGVSIATCRLMPADRFTKRHSWSLWAAIITMSLGMFIAFPPLMDGVLHVPALSDRNWILRHAGTAALVVGCVIALTVLSTTLSHILGPGVMVFQRLGRFGLNVLTLRLIQLIGLLIVIWCAAWLYSHVDFPPTAEAGVPLFAALYLALQMGRYVDRVSPHHAYRDLLVRCFSVIRTGPSTCAVPDDPARLKLSSLKPELGATKFPELLICAAANVSDIGATPAGSNALSLVLSPTEVVVPAVPGAEVPIERFEELQRPFALRKEWGPGITLASAVAMTGAAVSPAMGKLTRDHQRALFAALNLRLGVWLPNVLNPIFRHRGEPPPAGACAVRDPWSNFKIKIGLIEFIAELVGWHSEKADHLYVTDGGHYDSLGLVELLRRKCQTIWCVDATGDKPGRARALAEAMLTASGELGARISIELSRFALASHSTLDDPLLANTYAVGTIFYSDGSEGKLVVIKIGLTERSPDEVVEYRHRDRAFPHHSTMNQVYRAERFDAYRTLGWWSATEALSDDRASAA